MMKHTLTKLYAYRYTRVMMELCLLIDNSSPETNKISLCEMNGDKDNQGVNARMTFVLCFILEHSLNC